MASTDKVVNGAWKLQIALILKMIALRLPWC